MDIGKFVGRIGLVGFALGAALAAQAQQPFKFPPAPQMPSLTYTEKLDAMTSAGCRRVEADTHIDFVCEPGAADGLGAEASARSWHFTRPGQAEHPGYFVSYAIKTEANACGSALPLSRSYRQSDSGADLKAFDNWTKSFPRPATVSREEVERYARCAPGADVPLLKALPAPGEPFPRTQ